MDSKKIIICVDDEKIILDSLKGQLRRRYKDAFKYYFAESAKEALELMEQLMESNHVIDTIISDWLMPEMKGDELLNRVTDINLGINKILLTGHMDSEVVQLLECCNTIGIKCIYKPWDEESLMKLIESR